MTSPADQGPPTDGADPGPDLERLVDDLEAKVLSEAGDPEQKIADDAARTGTDDAEGEPEPPV